MIIENLEKVRTRKRRRKNIESSFEEFETIFFMLNFAVLTNDVQNAKDFLQILRESCEKQPTLYNRLDDVYKNRLRKLATLVDNNIQTTRADDLEESKNYYNAKKQSVEYVEKEKDIVRMIYHSHKLKSFLNDRFEIDSIEYQTEFGRVDLVGYDGTTIYPIEVKLNSGRHSVVSQIDKYMRSFWKKLALKLWKDVKGIVIAQKFEDYALKEFQQMNVIPFSYSIENSELTLVKL